MVKAIEWVPWLDEVIGCTTSALSISEKKEVIISGPEQGHQE